MSCVVATGIAIDIVQAFVSDTVPVVALIACCLLLASMLATVLLILPLLTTSWLMFTCIHVTTGNSLHGIDLTRGMPLRTTGPSPMGVSA